MKPGRKSRSGMPQMIPINRTYAPVQALADELARCGMRHAVTCPGSRNAPLLLSLAGHEAIQAGALRDERTARFPGLAPAHTAGPPAASTLTSGTPAPQSP